MQQIAIDPADIITIDFESRELPRAVQQFKPTLFRKGELICCILGPDEEHAIFGCGATEDEAIREWMNAFRLRLQGGSDEDTLAQYIKDTLSTSKKDVW